MIGFLLWLRGIAILNKLSYLIFKFIGVEIPISVTIGKNFQLPHWAYGTVIHSKTKIGNNVRIYQGVTIGRSDIYQDNSSLESITLEDNIILCAGSKLLVNQSCTIRSGVILGANSVLIVNSDIVESGVYVGIPAKKIK
jgi:serine O-acetyltransferase